MDIAAAAAGCEEQFAGLGQNVFVAYPEYLKSTPEYDEGKAAYTAASFAFKTGYGAWKFRIKKQSAQIQATGTEGAKGYSISATFTIDRDVENAAQVLRILKNRGDAIFFFENPAGGYYVVYDPTFGTELNNNYDTGTTPDSDSGHAVTVTCNPCRYALTTWNGTLTLASDATSTPSTPSTPSIEGTEGTEGDGQA
jgi:hypothetical protein